MPREYEGDATGAHSFPGRLCCSGGWMMDGGGVGGGVPARVCRWPGALGGVICIYVYMGKQAAVVSRVGLGGAAVRGWTNRVVVSALAGLVARAYLLEPSHWGFRERDGADGVSDDDGWLVITTSRQLEDA